MEPYLARRTLKQRFFFMTKFLTKTTLIFVALWTCVIAHKCLLENNIEHEKVQDRSMFHIILKNKLHFTSNNVSHNKYHEFPKCMEWRWQTMARLSHHLKKGRLIIQHTFEASVENSSAVFIIILFGFTNLKTTLNFPVSTIPGTFSMVNLVIVPLNLYWLIKVCH